ncbi:MAG: hypothetical protein IT328_08510 [Caldilineaceae bacterium]|nr:hypothetical protein [Caldilineaceae bacterium]
MSAARTLRPNFFALLILVGGLLLLGIDRFVEIPPLRTAALLVYEWGVLLSAFALLLGAINVAWVHVRRVVAGSTGWQQSLLLVVALAVVLVSGLFSTTGVRSPLVELLFDAIIAPGQATLFALLAFFMAAAAYRYLRIGRPGGVWLLAGVLLVFAVQMPVANALLPRAFANLIGWVVDVPAMSALRGALLGSSFALVIVAIRFLLTSR